MYFKTENNQIMKKVYDRKLHDLAYVDHKKTQKLVIEFFSSLARSSI